jgi:ethanolamine utilization protein EutQ (cupin superfamily)
VKHFRFRDLDLTPTADGPTLPLVNVGCSHDLGAGIDAFENCAVPWTVACDEVLFIKEGVLTLRVAGQVFRAGEGNVLWIPRDRDDGLSDRTRRL